MSEYHFPIPGSENEKEIVIFVRRHWAAFLGQFILSFIIFLIPIAILIILYIFDKNFFQGIVYNILVIILSIYYLVAITFAFVSWLSFYYNVYIITTKEIIDITQVGFFGRKISQLSLLRVQDVTSDIKGLLPTLFAYGDVLVETAGEKENFLICSVPNPQEISSKIMELHDQVIEIEGRHHQILEGEGALVRNISNPPEASKQEAQNQETPYQELLKKDNVEPKEGEVSNKDLDSGGEIDLK